MIDLSCWNLTLPYSVEGTDTPITITTPDLVAGYQDSCFFNGEDGALFRAYDGGASSANSSYPRCELRETYKGGLGFNWVLSEYTYRQLSAAVTVMEVPLTKTIVLGQIHVKNSTGPLCKVIYSEGDILLKFRSEFGEIEKVITLSEGVTLGERFTYGIKLTGKGGLSVWIGRSTSSGHLPTRYDTVLGQSWADKRLYFKAGVYSASTEGDEGSQSRALFHRLIIEDNKRV